MKHSCRFCGRPIQGPWEFCDEDCETDFDTFIQAEADKAADLDAEENDPDALLIQDH